ncbi:MAG: polysaccharide deacetylase [Sphingomonas sp.]|nr:polysaccharide deacetylase [Sphingomonas sp.]|tara:strand:- start:372 stop:1088 length:717 start_codon:yes stop_codon:yes gene_type:complete
MTQRARRRRAFGAAAAVLLLLAGAVGAWKMSKARCFALFITPLCHVDTQQKLVALTFDDGPTPEGVAIALDALARYDAHATFFLIGQEMRQRPGEARRLVDAGHEIANHSYFHRRMIDLLPGRAASEIRDTDALLVREGGATGLFRPPYGAKLTGLPFALRDSGDRMVMWDVEDPAEKQDARSYADSILAQVRPGSIILMHIMYRSRATARAALPLILDGLAARGYRVVTVSELLAAQ